MKKTARIAGLLYLLMGITGGFGIMYIPLNIIVAGDPAATVSNIVNSEWLFRFSILSNFISQILFIYLVLTLKSLLIKVNEQQARLMVIFVLVSVPIAFLNMLNPIAALVLLSGEKFLIVFQPGQLEALVLVMLRLYEQGTAIVAIFWGLWLFPFGVLVYRSRFIPKLIGVLLIIACFGYLANSFTSILFPDFVGIVAPVNAVTGTVGEFAVIFWLLIKGVRKSRIDKETKDEFRY